MSKDTKYLCSHYFSHPAHYLKPVLCALYQVVEVVWSDRPCSKNPHNVTLWSVVSYNLYVSCWVLHIHLQQNAVLVITESLAAVAGPPVTTCKSQRTCP